MQLLFKPVASNIKVVQPRLSPNSQNVDDKCSPRLNQRELVSLSVAVVPSMSEKDIDIKFMLSAIIYRTGVRTMDH